MCSLVASYHNLNYPKPLTQKYFPQSTKYSSLVCTHEGNITDKTPVLSKGWFIVHKHYCKSSLCKDYNRFSKALQIELYKYRIMVQLCLKRLTKEEGRDSRPCKKQKTQKTNRGIEKNKNIHLQKAQAS